MELKDITKCILISLLALTLSQKVTAATACNANLDPDKCIDAGGTPITVGRYACDCSNANSGGGTSTAGVGASGTIGLDGKWNWAAGYKFRTDESWYPGPPSKPTTFMDLELDPDHYIGPEITGKYVTIYSGYPVNQQTWGTMVGCGSEIECPDELDNSGSGGSGGVGTTNPSIPWCTGTRTVKYSCKSDVEAELKSSIASNRLQGGDSMYGTWGMLLSFFEPTIDTEDCTENGRCFVGNPFVIDTHAQFEKDKGMLTGLGKKVLEEGPGEVYYFDQLRALATGPDYLDKDDLDKPIYNEPHLIGDLDVLKICDGELFATVPNMPTQVSSYARTYFNAYVKAKLTPKVLAAYKAAEEVSGIPCEIFAGIHFKEGANNPTQSLLDGGALRGGDLITDAKRAGEHIKDHFDGVFTGTPFEFSFEGLTGTLSNYNGPGNNNCNPDVYGCFPTPYVPTRYRAAGNCGPVFYGEDNPYALAWLDTKHSVMDIITTTDFDPANPCANKQNIRPETNPGAVVIAILLHEMIVGP